VFNGLQKTGSLIPLNNKNHIWKNRKVLLERWRAEYATTLKPKLIKERYAIKDQWRNISFNTSKTAWGGGAASRQLTSSQITYDPKRLSYIQKITESI
jgi:hypothetical protein